MYIVKRDGEIKKIALMTYWVCLILASIIAMFVQPECVSISTITCCIPLHALLFYYVLLKREASGRDGADGSSHVAGSYIKGKVVSYIRCEEKIKQNKNLFFWNVSTLGCLSKVPFFIVLARQSFLRVMHPCILDQPILLPSQ